MPIARPSVGGFPLHLYMCSKLTVGVVRIKINYEDGPSVTCALARCSGGSRPKPRRAAAVGGFGFLSRLSTFFSGRRSFCIVSSEGRRFERRVSCTLF